jgi:hypothetical protein
LKKYISSALVALFMLFTTVTVVRAEVWYPANQATMAWDAVTTTVDSNGVEAAVDPSEISYEIFRTDAAAPDKENAESLGTTTELTFLITFTDGGKYMIGVRAIRTVPGFSETLPSAIAWSDDPVATSGNPFGVQFLSSPSAPTALRMQ